MKTKLIALKAFRYGRERIKAGQSFTAARSDAKLLVAIAHAKHDKPVEIRKVITTKVEKPAPAYRLVKPQRPTESVANTTPAISTEDSTEIDILRLEFLIKTGSNPDRRWGVTRLQSELNSLNGEEKTETEIINE